LAYVRPEKQTVENQRQGAMTVANAVAKPLDKARPIWTGCEPHHGRTRAWSRSARSATPAWRRLTAGEHAGQRGRHAAALAWIATGLLIGGIIFLVGGILLIVIPVRRAS
jgi:hypothetical protein